jgi:hypothetical protein
MDDPTSYRIRGAASDRDLLGILALQAVNLPAVLAPDERAREGFVTLQHDLALLRDMNSPWPHLIAALGEEVVAYALVMLPSYRERLPLLESMFERMDGLRFRGTPLLGLRWYVMGQICVAAGHRGRGLVDGLYAGHRQQMTGHFDVMVTEIDRANPRSLRAHEKAGFEVIDEHRADGRDWVVVASAIAPA